MQLRLNVRMSASASGSTTPLALKLQLLSCYFLIISTGRRVVGQYQLNPLRSCYIVSADDIDTVLRVVRGEDEHATRDVQQALVR